VKEHNTYTLNYAQLSRAGPASLPEASRSQLVDLFTFEFILFLQGQCTLMNVSVKVTVLASQLIFNRSPWAGY
jgi:hypothetical protein